jgi:uncharacterized protein YutE (UPF0331/DUF86 family)
VTTEFDSKTNLDFRNRLIAKFAIPRARSTFWGSGFDQIPESALYPRGDQILDLCTELKSQLKDELQPGDLGTFIREWATLEEFLLDTARRLTERNVSLREAATQLARLEVLSSKQAQEVEAIRTFRNNLVHKPGAVEPDALHGWIERLRQTLKAIPQDAG